MSTFVTNDPTGATDADLWVNNPSGSTGETFAGFTGTSGSILSGSVHQTYSSYTFVNGGLSYTYTGAFEVDYQAGLLSGTVSASGFYDHVTVTGPGGVIDEYDGVQIPVDFGSAQTGLLGTVVGLLGVVNNLLFGGANQPSIANLHLDATPELPAIAFVGNDTLTGNVGPDVLSGFAGNDIIIGGAGADILDGGTGVDTTDYTDSSAAVQVNLTTGIGLGGHAQGDVLTNFENVTGSAFNDTLTGTNGANVLVGGDGNDTLFGMDGNDTLNGGSGSDIMHGGVGNDLYYVGSVGDQPVELANQGTDTVYSTISYTLGDNLENLRLAGPNAINGTGNAEQNVILGNNANNVIDGGGGIDIMRGGLGNDTYIVDTSGDRVVEGLNAGADTVLTSASYKLGSNIENVTMTDHGSINVTGNALNNVIVGNDGANGLNGGLGADTLTGGLGADSFVFQFAPINGNIDTITDFTPVDDVIRLSSSVFLGLSTGYLAADALAIGSAAADASDRVIYDSQSGDLFFDRDGSGQRYAAVQFATLTPGLELTNKDFVIFAA